MSVCRVLGKLSNHVIEVVFFSMHIWYCVPPSNNALTGDVRKIKALTRSRAQDRSVYYVTCVRLTWVSYVVDTTIRDNLLEYKGRDTSTCTSSSLLTSASGLGQFIVT